MPATTKHAVSGAPPEEVWKLLYDPARIPEWWAGVERVTSPRSGTDDKRFAIFTEADPGSPLPQVLQTARDGPRIVISCLTFDARFEWKLTPLAEGTRIDAELELPEEHADLYEPYAGSLAASVQSLARLAEREARPD